jgi:23S rRNA pseudouridine1911/1915/1917 synthase
LTETVQFTASTDDQGKRLDVLLAERLPGYSRVQLRRAVNSGGVTVDGQGRKASDRLRSGQVIVVRLPEAPREGPLPEPIPLEILYEDAHLAAINKPPGMVVHPARGHWRGTLASALAHHSSNSAKQAARSGRESCTAWIATPAA